MSKLKRQSENQRRKRKLNDMQQRRKEGSNFMINTHNKNLNEENCSSRISSKLRQQKYLSLKKNAMKHKNRMKKYHASLNFEEKHKIYERIRLLNFDEYEKHLFTLKTLSRGSCITY